MDLMTQALVGTLKGKLSKLFSECAKKWNVAPETIYLVVYFSEKGDVMTDIRSASDPKLKEKFDL